jgi:hypothetical protein
MNRVQVSPWRQREPMGQAQAAVTQNLENVMRITIGNFPVASEERLTFAKQMGLNGVVLNTPQLLGRGTM